MNSAFEIYDKDGNLVGISGGPSTAVGAPCLGPNDLPVEVYRGGTWVTSWFSSIRADEFFSYLKPRNPAMKGRFFHARSDVCSVRYQGTLSFVLQECDLVTADHVPEPRTSLTYTQFKALPNESSEA